jgi:carbonic anhydrase
MTARERILLESRLWRTEKEVLDKDYFKHLDRSSKPSIFWIESFGNVASVVEVTNIEPDEIVVYRNMGGQCKSDDPSFMAALESFVDSPEAAYVIVCGHNQCQGIRDTIAGKELGPHTSRWMEDVHELYEQHAAEMASLTARQQERKLSELNVRRQLLNLSTVDVIERAWSGHRNLMLLGWYLDLHKGEIHEVCSMSSQHLLTEVSARR